MSLPAVLKTPPTSTPTPKANKAVVKQKASPAPVAPTNLTPKKTKSPKKAVTPPAQKEDNRSIGQVIQDTVKPFTSKIPNPLDVKVKDIQAAPGRASKAIVDTTKAAARVTKQEVVRNTENVKQSAAETWNNTGGRLVRDSIDGLKISGQFLYEAPGKLKKQAGRTLETWGKNLQSFLNTNQFVANKELPASSTKDLA